MIIDLKRLDILEQLDIDYVVTINELGFELDKGWKLESDIAVTGYLMLIDADAVSVNLDVTYTISDACARCLDRVSVVNKFTIREVFMKSLDSDYVLPADELLDLSGIVTERIILSLPTRLLCSEDCKGLCHSCGLNLNRGECNCGIEESDMDDNPFALLRDKITKGGANDGSTKKKTK